MKGIIASTILALLLIIVNPQSVLAQTCTPTPEIVITTDIAGDTTISLSSTITNNNLVIRSETIEMWILYSPGRTSPMPHMTISNGYHRGHPEFTEVSVYNRAHEEPVTLNIREPWSSLWSISLDLIREINASEEFWNFIADNDDYPDDLHLIFSDFINGLYTPYINYDQMSLRYIYGYQYEIDMMADGYSLRYGDTTLDIVTPNEFNDIYVLLSAQMPNDRWVLHINPDDESTLIQWGWSDCAVQISEDEYGSVLVAMKETLEFFKNHNFEGLGDLREYIDLALQGLDYEVNISYTDRYREYDMIGPAL